MILLSLIVLHGGVQALQQGLVFGPPCSFLCGDGLTCLSSEQVCDAYYDCPAHGGGEGGEDEAVCNSSLEEEPQESVPGLRSTISTLCLDSQSLLVGDPTDCSVFYHCSEAAPAPQSCGDLMFHPQLQTCAWPRSVMQVRPECRDPSSFTFRLGPRSWDSRRTHRMLRWLGPRSNGRALVRARARPQNWRGQHRQRVQPFRTTSGQALGELNVLHPDSMQVRDQQRTRAYLVPQQQQRGPQVAQPIIGNSLVETGPMLVMPARLQVPQEAPRPHVVKLVQPQMAPAPAPSPQLVRLAQPQPVLQVNAVLAPRPRVVKLPQPEAPRPHVVKLSQPEPFNSAFITQQITNSIEQSIRKRITSQPKAQRPQVVRIPAPEAPRPHVVKLNQAQPSSTEPFSAEALTKLISSRIEQSIRERIPAFRNKVQVAKQTQQKQKPIKRVTHTVTSTSSQVNAGKPSHHYVQNTVVGKDVESKDQMVTMNKMGTTEKMDIKKDIEHPEEEETDIIPTIEKVVEKKKVIIPKDALVDVKHRPVWTLDSKQRATLTRVGPSETTRQGRPDRKIRIRKKLRRRPFGEVRKRLQEPRRIVLKTPKKLQQPKNMQEPIYPNLLQEEQLQEEQLRELLQEIGVTEEAALNQLQEKARMLLAGERVNLKESELEALGIAAGLGNSLEKEQVGDFAEDERKAVSLKESFDRAINKLEVEVDKMEREEEARQRGNQMRDMTPEDGSKRYHPGPHQYIDSSRLRGQN